MEGSEPKTAGKRLRVMKRAVQKPVTRRPPSYRLYEDKCASCGGGTVLHCIELCLGDKLGHSAVIIEACKKCGRVQVSATPRSEAQ